MANLDNLIGSHLSLISLQDVRYDGILFSINAKESSIVLKDVKCFGSEDRIKEDYKKIAPNPTILAFVTFPGNEIKDLSVFESSDVKNVEPVPIDSQPAKNANAFTGSRQPNIELKQLHRSPQVEGSKEKENNPIQRQNSRQNTSANTRVPQQQQRHQHKPAEVQEKRQSQPEPKKQVERQTMAPSAAGTGEHLAKLRLRKGEGSKEEESTSDIKAIEFDFAAGLNAFNKTEVLATVATEAKTAGAPRYVKDDFFDMLSNDSSAVPGAASRSFPQSERVLNQDTFGAIAVQLNYRRSGGYRRGGRRGGRGGHPNSRNFEPVVG